MFIVKRDSFLELQCEVKWYYKVGQVLKRRTIFITKWVNVITNWDNSYKVVQYRRQMKETGKIDFYNLFLHSTLICLASVALIGIIETLKFCYNQKKEAITSPPQTYLCDF